MGRLRLLHEFVVALALLTLACETGDTVATGPGSAVEIRPPQQNVVCDPFSNDPGMQGHGLVGNLYYLSDDQPRYSAAKDYMLHGHPVDATLYFNELNVPTRPFDQGFVNQNNQVFTNANGNTLYEYFGLHIESGIDLANNDAAGDYQFALLSDDGSVMEVNDSLSGYRTLINNDGQHPTRMGCATTPVHVSGQAPVPIKIDYNQGPRLHIALMLLWRPWPTTNPVNDPLCGQQGNGLFFDSTQNPSAPQAAYNSLLSRGWRPVPAANLKLQGSETPCVVSEPAVLSNFRISNITQTSFVATWTTDIASTSRVAFTLDPNSGYSYTAIDSTMTTDHSVTVTGLQAFGFYSVYAISKNSSNQDGTSNVLTVRTLR